VPFFRLTVNDPRWLKIFHTTIEFEHPIQADYRVYQKKPLFPLEKILIPEGFKMLSVDAFIQNSFVVAAINGGSLADWCLSEYNF